MSSNYRPGDQFLGRYLPHDGRFWPTGAGIVLGPRLTPSALELVETYASHIEILEWYARLHLPPTMNTTEGEPFTVLLGTKFAKSLRASSVMRTPAQCVSCGFVDG